MTFDKETRKLTADEGKILQNVHTKEYYGSVIYLGSIDSFSNYQDAIEVKEQSSESYLWEKLMG